MNENKRCTIGIDIGTTTICAVLRDTETGKLQDVRNIPNDTNLPGAHPWEHMQDPDGIADRVMALLSALSQECTPVGIGVTGQMHGILYTDPAGNAVSPLYTWQDGRAGVGEPSAVAEIHDKTGYNISAGYGLATHLALTKTGEVPETAAYLCTVMDWITMRLTSLSRPVIHAGSAASLGLYRMDDDAFDTGAMETLGLDPAMLPEVTADIRELGRWNGIPVYPAIGDNQAAFLGSVQNGTDTVLVNIGTGSQISLLCSRDEPIRTGSVETRPYLGDKRLLSGSGLCGGRAYAMLERFFAGYRTALGLPGGERYDVLNALAEKGLTDGRILPVRTTFCGTRENPSLLGQITDIGEDDLTPEGLAAGMLYGIAAELYGMYETMPHDGIRTVAASGNAVRKNPVLQQILQNMFGLPVYLPEHTEEAACGAARLAAEIINTKE